MTGIVRTDGLLKVSHDTLILLILVLETTGTIIRILYNYIFCQNYNSIIVILNLTGLHYFLSDKFDYQLPASD